jgi:phosphoglycerate kinase
MLTLEDVDLRGATVLVRVDINSPINPTDGTFLDITRFERSLPTLRELADSKVVVLAHQSRPGKADYTTLREHTRVLGRLLGRPSTYVDDLIGSKASRAIRTMEVGELLVLENTRLFAEETTLSKTSLETQSRTHLVRNLANVADAYVTDAFSAAHRSQPSLVGFFDRLPCIAGRLFEREVDGLSRALGGGERPVVVVLGGVKADDSVRVAANVLESGGADMVLTGGLVANVFLAASGVNIGEVNLRTILREMEGAKQIIENAGELLKSHKDKLMVPVDVAQKPDGDRIRARIEDLDPELPIMDIGLDTVVQYIHEIKKAGTVVANGPMGVFEEDVFAFGTKEVFSEIGKCEGYTVLGGGHTGVVARALGIDTTVNHVSTAGGAMIHYLAGGEMPVIEALKRSKKLFMSGEFAIKPDRDRR